MNLGNSRFGDMSANGRVCGGAMADNAGGDICSGSFLDRGMLAVNNTNINALLNDDQLVYRV
jgi:hypothetical protein